MACNCGGSSSSGYPGGGSGGAGGSGGSGDGGPFGFLKGLFCTHCFLFWVLVIGLVLFVMKRARE